VVSFDHRDVGTAERDWSDGRWARLPAVDLEGVHRALVISAHPDDETLGAGGLVALLSRAGADVTFLLATRGEAGHRVDLSAERQAEFATAVDRLAPGSRIHDVGLPDGGLRESADALTAAIVDALDDTDLIVAPWSGDGHRDHRIAGETAASVAREHGIELLEYPVWLWHWGTPESPEIPWDRLAQVPLDDDAQRTKARALAAYETQLTGIAGEAPVLHDGMVHHFSRAWETFVRTPA
jgi:LmbE family N-acetylglucosaminyl deacetylase